MKIKFKTTEKKYKEGKKQLKKKGWKFKQMGEFIAPVLGIRGIILKEGKWMQMQITVMDATKSDREIQNIIIKHFLDETGPEYDPREPHIPTEGMSPLHMSSPLYACSMTMDRLHTTLHDERIEEDEPTD